MFQDLPDVDEDNCYQLHHEIIGNFEKTFRNGGNKLFKDLLNNGNPFGECEQDLVNVPSKTVVNKESSKSVREALSTMVQKSEIIEERLAKKTKSLHDHKLPLLNPKIASKSSKGKEKINLVKADCRLFPNLYIVSQSRTGDLNNFLAHENYAFLVSLSEYGKI